MAAQSIGERVTVRGEAWEITGMEGCSHLGAKFFGKVAFELRRVSDGATSRYVGKRVAAQCSLTVAEPEPVAEPERCDHYTGQLGCALPTCQGVPVGVDVHTSETVAAEPVGYESGHAASGRDMTHAMRRTGLVVTLPTTFESRWDRGNVRKISGYDLTANGHAVRVLSYESRGPLGWCGMPYAAVYVDGQLISSEQPMWGGAAKFGHAIAYAVACHVDTLRAAKVAAEAAEVARAAEAAEVARVAEAAKVAEAAERANRTPLVATVDRDSLADALAFVAKSIPRRPSVPVLSGVQLSAEGGRVTVAAFDYDSSREVDVPADDVTAGRVLIGYKSLADVVKKLPKRTRVSLAEVGAAVTVECGRVRLSLPTMPAEDYPTLPPMPDTVGTLPARVFADTVARVAVAAGTDETLAMMTGVRLEAAGDCLAMLSTDRYRLGIREVAWSGEGFNALVPAVTLADVAKRYGKIRDGRVSVGVDIGAHGVGTVSLACGPYRATTRTLEDVHYPPVRKVVPADSALVASAVVDAADMLGAIDRAGSACERTQPVRLMFADGEVTVIGGGGDSAEVAEPVACEWSGEWPGDELTIAFQPSYLADGVKAAGTDRVRIRLVDAFKPALILPTGAGVYGPADLYLIMPVRISGASGERTRPEAAKPAEPVADVAEPVAGDASPEPVAPVAEVPEVPAAEPVADSVPEVPAEDAEPEPDSVPAEPGAVDVDRACRSLTQRARQAANLRGSDRVSVRYAAETGRVSVKGAQPPADMVGEAFGRAYRFDSKLAPAYGGFYAYYVPVSEPVGEVAEVPADAATVAEPVAAAEVPEPVAVAEPGADIMARAVDAYAAGDLAGALAAVAEGESVAPAYRSAGASGTAYGWAEMRASLPAEPVAKPAEPVAATPAEPEPAEVAEVPAERVWAFWRLSDSEVTVIRDRRAGVSGPAGTYPAVTREDAAEVLADAGYTMVGGFRADPADGSWVCDLEEIPAGPVDFPMPEPFNAPAAVAEPVAPSVPEPVRPEVPAETEPVAASAVDVHAAILAQLGRAGSVAPSVPAPVRVAVPDTAAAVVAGWRASDLPVPVSPAPAPAPVAEPVPAGEGAEPVAAGPVPAWTYAAGMRVRTILKEVRPEVARRMRDGGVKVGRVSIVPDRDARAVAVTLDGVAEGDTSGVWAIVAEVMGGHAFTPAEVAAEV